MNTDSLYAALGAIPDLRGARCRGRSDLFDESDCPELTEAALHFSCSQMAGRSD